MKDLARTFVSAAVLIATAIVAYILYLLTEWLQTPAAEPTFSEIESALWWGAFRGWVFVGVIAAFGLVIAVSTCLFAWWLIAKGLRIWRESQYIYPGQDGSLPVVPTKYVGRDQYGRKVVYETFHDLEKAIDPTTVFAKNGSVQVATHSQAESHVQSDHARQVTNNRHNAAVRLQKERTDFIKGSSSNRQNRPNRAELEDLAGVNEEKRRNIALKNQLIEERLAEKRRSVVQDTAPPKIQVPIEPMTLSEACRGVSENIVILGRNQHTGRPVRWEITHQSHLRIHGATNAGKSTMLRSICVYLVQKKHGLIFLDNSSGVDFRIFKNVAQLVDCKDPNLLLAALRKIWAEVEAREQLIVETVSEDDDGKYENIPEAVRPQRIFVILDEYADHVAEAALYGLDEDVMALVDRLCAKARKTGIHLIFGDQKPTSDAWTTRIKENVQAVLCSKMSKHIASSVYGQPLPDIAGKHVFAYNDGDQLVKAPFEPAFIKAMREYHEGKPSPVYINLTESVKLLSHYDAVATEAQTSPKLQKCLEYLKDNPGCTQGEMRRALKVSKGTASSAWKLYHQGVQ
ncbi:MAG: FtsK/SpoIIIE domain-containing protein [Chloroflexota bacterium]